MIRAAKVVTLDESMVIKTLGRLAAADRDAVRSSLSSLFRPVLDRT